MPERGRVVEVGSGEGKILRTLARHHPDLELHGCDIRTPEVPPDVYQAHRMGRDIPLPDGSMDAVLFADVLEHVPDPRHLLAEAARVLRPGGRLVACIPIEGEPISLYALFRRILGDDTYALTKEHVNAFTHEGLRSLVSEHFVVSKVRYAYHAMGHAMDATFFAAARAPWLRNFWWQDNVFYNSDKREAPGLSGLMNRLLVVGNVVAWAESRLLARTRMTSAAVLVDAVVSARQPDARVAQGFACGVEGCFG
jgi:SAM-dependent methyltransferase